MSKHFVSFQNRNLAYMQNLMENFLKQKKELFKNRHLLFQDRLKNV